jgi:hypothetical protein
MTQERPLSYAQNMEDYHLSLAFAGKERGTYIDVGGGHPVAGSATFWFYKRGWNGVVVEPKAIWRACIGGCDRAIRSCNA